MMSISCQRSLCAHLSISCQQSISAHLFISCQRFISAHLSISCQRSISAHLSISCQRFISAHLFISCQRSISAHLSYLWSAVLFWPNCSISCQRSISAHLFHLLSMFYLCLPVHFLSAVYLVYLLSAVYIFPPVHFLSAVPLCPPVLLTAQSCVDLMFGILLKHCFTFLRAKRKTSNCQGTYKFTNKIELSRELKIYENFYEINKINL